MKNTLLPLLIIIASFACSTKSESEEAKAEKENSSNLIAFPYIAPAPENGVSKGVIELGGDGFNAFLIEVDEVSRWRLINADFGVSEVYDQKVTEEKVQEGLKTYIDNLLSKGVSADNIHFIQSSTADKSDQVKKINAALKSFGYEINTVDVKQEASLGYLATMPEKYSSESFFVDIGSGNTKVAWMENGVIKTINTYGSKYYVDGKSHAEVSQEIHKLMKQVPAKNFKHCFIIGGGPYQLAKQSEDFNERYAVLKKPSAYTANSGKVECAINIYKSIYEATEEKSNFIFDWESNFSIGFLLSL